MQRCQAGEADRTAMGSSAEELRIGVGDESAGVISYHIQTADRLSVFLDRFHVGVDYGRYFLLKNDTSRPLRLLKDHLIHRGFQERQR